MPIFNTENGRTSASPLDWMTGLGGIAGNVLGLISGVNANKKANETNLRIAEMNNRAQLDMFNRGMLFNKSEREATQDFNRQMWYEQQRFLNQYNDPSAVASRLRGVGLNPALVMGGDSQAASLGSVSSSPASAPSAPSLTSPSVIPEFNTGDFQGALTNIAGFLNAFADLDAKHIDNETKRARNLNDLKKQLQDIDESIERIKSSKQGRRESASRIEFLKEQKRELGVRIDIAQFQRDNQEKMFNLTSEQMRANIDGITQQIAESKERAALIQLQRQWGADANSREWKKLSADIRLINSQVKLNNEQCHKLAQDVCESIERVCGIKLDNDVKEKVQNLVVEQAKRDDERDKMQLEADKLQNWYETDPKWIATDKFIARLGALIPFASGMKSSESYRYDTGNHVTNIYNRR